MQEQQRDTRQSFLSIEGLRGWLAWWVVAGHLLQLVGGGGYLPDFLSRILGNGGAAVNVFVIISGFVIAHLCTARQEPYRLYIARRFLRVAPIYFVTALVAYLSLDWYQSVYIDKSWVQGQEMRSERDAAFDNNPIPYLLAHLTLLHGAIPEFVLPYSSSTILAPAWSLSLEWQFYLIAPFFVAAVGGIFGRRPWPVVLVLAAGLVATFFLGKHYQFPSFFFLSVQYFALGVFSRLALDKMKAISLSPEALIALTVATALLLFRSLELAIWSLFMVFVLQERGLVAAGSVYFEFFRHAIAGSRAVRFAGKMSYSTYLWHIPFFVVVLTIVSWFVGPLTQSDYIFYLMVSLPVLVLLSWLSFLLIEKPFVELGKRLKKNPDPQKN